MSNVYSTNIAMARRLIATKGQKVQWKVLTPTVGAEEWKPAAAKSVLFEVDMVFLPDDKRNFESIVFKPGTNVPEGNIVGYLAGTNMFEPNQEDTVIRNGKELRISTIETIAPNGTNILHIIRFKE